MNQQLAILQQIIVDPGSISREYGSIISQYSADGVAQLKTTAGDIKDVYITNTSDTVNQHFAEQVDEHGNRIITKNFEDLANISPDASRDDKANIILSLLVDQYNRNQAASVNTYLNKYTKESLTNESNDTSVLMSQLKNIEYVYQNRRTSLNNERKIYSDQRENYARELESLKENITTFELEKLAAQEKLDNAKNLNEYNDITAAAHVQESAELIDDIIEDSAHQLNVTLLKEYIQWILWLQSSLQKQVGQIYAGIEDGNGYAELMQQYINLYEGEAFEFLHWFDALPEDLEDGFQGTGGMNRKFKSPNTYFLKDYKDTRRCFLKLDYLNSFNLFFLTSQKSNRINMSLLIQHKPVSNLNMVGTFI